MGAYINIGNALVFRVQDCHDRFKKKQQYEENRIVNNRNGVVFTSRL